MTRPASSDVLATIEALDDDFGYWVWTKAAPAAEDVEQLEEEAGIPLPADYLAFVKQHGCAAVQAVEEVWARPQAYAVGPLWAHQYGLEIYGTAQNVPPPLSMLNRLEKLRDEGISDLVPVAGPIGSGPTLAVDGEGRFVWLWLDKGDRVPEKGTFTEIIQGRLKLLAEEKEKAKKAGKALWK